MKPTEFKTWEDICEALSIDPVASLAFADQLPDEDKAAQLAFFKLTKLSKASYGDKKPNWSDTNEYKYWPYFDMNDEEDPAGFGFSGTNYVRWLTGATVGSRLCYPSSAMAEHAGTQFIDWYRDMMVLPKEIAADEKN